ncbi:hypothetical protein [Streptomyces sp. NPDC048473]|uniref:hypothetical protein n=1 Tax=unclassified Streptomyces TaxID=2593676 RepID=UPI0037102786
MDHSKLLATVWQMLDARSPSDAPSIIDVPDGTTLQELVAAIGGRAGRFRNIASGGFTAPSLAERTGLPLVEPFGEKVLEMRGWAYWSHWIGCGQVASPEGSRLVVVVAGREDPAAGGLPEDASWTEKLRILTGWEPIPQPAVDWSAAEAALGTALPRDYKETVDLFGVGSFDWYLDLLVPGIVGMDLVKWAESDVEHAAALWHPYVAHPAPHGLLRWGTSEQEIDFVWQTGAADPDDWPVLVRHDFHSWERFDCGFGEFVLRMLTDVQFGFPTSGIAAHSFVSFDLP